MSKPRSLIGGVDDQRVVTQPLFLQRFHQPPHPVVHHRRFGSRIDHRHGVVDGVDRAPGGGSFTDHLAGRTPAPCPCLKVGMNGLVRHRRRVLTVALRVPVARREQHGRRQHVRPVVRQVQEEGFPSALPLPDKLDRLVRPKIREVLLHTIMPPVINDFLVVESRGVARRESHPPRESQLRALVPPQVVFAHQSSEIAGVRQRLRKVAELLDRRPAFQLRLRRQGHVDARLRRHQAGQQGGAGRRTNTAGGKGVAEQHPRASQSVDMGRCDLVVAVGAQQPRGLVVRNDQDEVRTLCSGRFLSGRAWKYRGKQK